MARISPLFARTACGWGLLIAPHGGRMILNLQSIKTAVEDQAKKVPWPAKRMLINLLSHTNKQHIVQFCGARWCIVSKNHFGKAFLWSLAQPRPTDQTRHCHVARWAKVLKRCLSFAFTSTLGRNITGYTFVGMSADEYSMVSNWWLMGRSRSVRYI